MARSTKRIKSDRDIRNPIAVAMIERYPRHQAFRDKRDRRPKDARRMREAMGDA